VDLLVIRHAIAGDRREWGQSGKPDEERPVTTEGRAKMRAAARGLAVAIPTIDVLATSPYARARQTADILHAQYGGSEPVEAAVLAHGGSPPEVLAWITRHQDRGVVAIVGHEPDLGELIGWLLSGESAAPVPLKKGGACLLRFDAAPAVGAATLVWLLTPKLLRRLGQSA
jgi:phosphohistidine phosphatase